MIKKLSRCVREYKRPAILTPIFVSAEVLLEVLIPFRMASLIDYIQASADAGAAFLPHILRAGGWLVLLCLASLTFGTLAGRTVAVASAGFAKNLRGDLYHAVQDYAFSNIDKFSTASIVTRLTTDVTNVQMAFMFIIRIAVRSPVMLILSLVMSFLVSPQLALIFLCTVPVLGVGLYLIMTNAHPIFERVFRTYDRLNSVVQENLRGIRVVKGFVREDYEKKKFAGVSQSIYGDFTKAEKLLAFNSPLMQLCMYACILLIAWFGAHLINTGSLTTGNLMSLITYTSLILTSLMMMSMVLVQVTIARASAERICELLDEKSALTDPARPASPAADGSVEFDGVTFSYAGAGGTPCLRNVNLRFASGQTVGIVGGTGSSKSTLVQLIPRLYDATEGSVKVGGLDVRAYGLGELRSAVAMVLQKNTLFSGTILDNLRWGNPNASQEECVRVCKIAQADAFISAFPDGYETHVEQGGANLSGGQRQRICIARALLKRPKVLILDDSTSAVDTRTDACIRRALREELPGTTKIVIAQRISSIQEADQIVVLDGGAVQAVGTHEELVRTCPIYREVYESQVKGGGEHE